MSGPWCHHCSSSNIVYFRLKRFDESTVVSRMGSQAPTPPLSVKGIGNKGSHFFTCPIEIITFMVFSCEA